jgi:molybdopterin-guanine dinucleotide biosynthesis protein A
VSLGGVILCGGRSSRFGSEKAIAELDGQPLVAIVAAVLCASCDRVCVSAPAGCGAARWAMSGGLEVISDGQGPHRGPLFGVLAGLRWAESLNIALMVTAPCDVPRLPFDFVSRLAAAPSAQRGAVAANERGETQPLCALWPRAARTDLEAALSAGGHPAVRDLLKDLGFQKVVFDELGAFVNVNTPHDLNGVRARTLAATGF